MKKTFDDVSFTTSKVVTKIYSTSFSLGVKFLSKKFQNPIYGIYGFVRFADEIVDSFHDYPKEELLKKFKEDTYQAIHQKISLNPVLNSFQAVVNHYNIPTALIETFLNSMEMDLTSQQYNTKKYEAYILGSAEVVGLMCLKVFTENNDALYNELKNPAMKLGAAFQKINFLRDYRADASDLGRIYFPQLNNATFTQEIKMQIEEEILADFDLGFEGIKKLPKDARFGVYVSYIYYKNLLNKIKQLPVEQIMQTRIRIPNNKKYALFFGSYLRHSLNFL